jgi:TPR repeat protein
VTWFRRAFRNGERTAAGFLCAIYDEGRGAARDPVEAYAWCMLAIEAGNKAAKKAEAEMRGKLTQEQIKSAVEKAELYRTESETGERRTHYSRKN